MTRSLYERGVGVPWLFAAAYSAVGFSIYFALGVVADRGLGLTPLIFLASGLLFGLTTAFLYGHIQRVWLLADSHWTEPPRPK
jgi:hypothetical protein